MAVFHAVRAVMLVALSRIAGPEASELASDRHYQVPVSSSGLVVPTERIYEAMTGGPQPGGQVSLPPGTWFEHAQDIHFDGNRLCARLKKMDFTWNKDCIMVYGTQQFIADDGKFKLGPMSQGLVDEYTSINYPTDLPPGSWQLSARNAYISGTTLFAELQKDDGSWVKAWTNVYKWHFLLNKDGAFYLSAAPCASMGSCLPGYLLSAGAADIYCASAVCDQTYDLHTCCRQVQSCSFMTTCGYGLVPDLLGSCRGLVCDQLSDQDICCVPAAMCTTLECPQHWVLKPDAASLICKGSVCFPSVDSNTCCDPQAKCRTLGVSHDACPNNEYFDFEEYCAVKNCVLGVDLPTCCKPAMDCERGVNCTHGYLAKPNSSDTYCPAPECDIDLHLHVCCDAADPCSSVTCGNGYYQEPNMFCAGTVCNPAQDFNHCCFRSASCSTFASHDCIYGEWFDVNEWCDRGQCLESAGDRQKCCKPSEPCSSLACPHGYVDKLDVSSRTCTWAYCDVALDVDRCCDIAAHCDTLACPHSYTPDPGANDTYCLAVTCFLATDRDRCCVPAPDCATHYTCPHGFTPWPNTYCDGVSCDFTRDRDICCRPAMPCDVLACPTNYVMRPDTYCFGIECVIERDLYWCCARGMALANYRWVVTDLRQEGYTVVQASEIRLWNFQINLAISNVWCDPCDSPVNNRENPIQLVDGKLTRKWLDYSRLPVNIELRDGAQPTFYYQFATGDDAPERDPWTWQLLGSPDGGKTWVVLHEIADRDHNLVPLARKTWTQNFVIGVPCFAPSSMFTPNTPNITCEEGDVIRHERNCTAVCLPGYTPSVTTLMCAGGEMTPEDFQCVQDVR